MVSPPSPKLKNPTCDTWKRQLQWPANHKVSLPKPRQEPGRGGGGGNKPLIKPSILWRSVSRPRQTRTTGPAHIFARFYLWEKKERKRYLQIGKCQPTSGLLVQSENDCIKETFKKKKQKHFTSSTIKCLDTKARFSRKPNHLSKTLLILVFFFG